MTKIRGLLIRLFRLNESMHAVHVKQKILETQLDYLIKNSTRKMRKKWHRMISHPTSKYYVGNIYKE